MRLNYIISTTLFLITFLLSGCGDDIQEQSTAKSGNELIAIVKCSNIDEANKMLHYLDSIEKTKKYSEDIINAYRNKIYFDIHQYRTAEFYGTKALKDKKLRDESRMLYYMTYQYLISIGFDNGDYKKALNYATECLNEARKDNTEEGQLYTAKFLSKISQGQIRLNRLEEGYKSSDESYEIFSNLLSDCHEFNNVYMWYSSVGEDIQHFAICDINKALEYIPRLEQTYEAAVNTKDIPPSMKDYCLSKLELTKAEIYARANKKVEARKHFERYLATETAKSGEDWISPQGYYESIGMHEKVKEIYDKWDEICDAEHIPYNKERLQILSSKFMSEYETGKKPEALTTAYRIITNMATADSLTHADDAAQLAVIYETQEKEAKIAEQNASLTHQRLIAILIAFILMVIFFVVFIYFRHRAAKRLEKAHGELQDAYEKLEETTTAKERIESELRIARDIQMSMVPSVFPHREGLDLYASMTPARAVGGDLYDYLLDGDSLYFCVGDVSGKGVPASLFMAQCIRLFRALAKQHQMPADIANRLNSELTEKNDNGMFVTMFIGLANLNTGHLYFCNAGHNPPIIGGDARHGSFLEMEPNAPIGLWSEIKYVGEEIESIMNKPLFVYTDGLNEAENQEQQQFGDERLINILRQTHFENAQQVIEHLEVEVKIHRQGAESNDDLTMLCLRITKNK